MDGSAKRSGCRRLACHGDISESTDLLFQLDRMHRHAEVPIYFVLGNHDFYRGSIRSVRAQVRAHCKSRTELHYLTGQDAIDLNESWSLVGHDGWGDAMLGHFEQSPVQLADFHAIEDLARLPRPVLYERLRELGRDASETLRPSLWNALNRGRNLLVATHVPPLLKLVGMKANILIQTGPRSLAAEPWGNCFGVRLNSFPISRS